MSAKYSEAGVVLQISYLRVIFHFWSVHTFGCIKTVKVCGKIYSSLEIESKLGPGRTGQIFVYFAKKSVTSSLRQVRPVVFRSNKFCQGLPNFKDAVVLPQSRTNFLSGVKSDRFVNLYVMISRKVSIKKIWSLFLVVFQSEASQNYFTFARQSNDILIWR